MAAHACLKNEFTEDDWYHNLMLILPYWRAVIFYVEVLALQKREYIWTASSEFGTYSLCEQRRFRRACASAQSRQNLRCSLIQAVNQEEPSDRKPDPWPLWMAGHAQLKFVMTECSKTQIRLAGLICYRSVTTYKGIALTSSSKSRSIVCRRLCSRRPSSWAQTANEGSRICWALVTTRSELSRKDVFNKSQPWKKGHIWAVNREKGPKHLAVCDPSKACEQLQNSSRDGSSSEASSRSLYSEEQIRWVFDDNWRIIFVSSPHKDMLWALIRIASVRRF